RPWPNALLPLSLNLLKQGNKQAAASDLQELERRLGELIRALGAQPFGDPHKVVASARPLVAWSDRVLGELKTSRFDAAVVRQLLLDITEAPKKGHPDFDSARQLSWAFRTLASPELLAEKDVAAILAELQTALK